MLTDVSNDFSWFLTDMFFGTMYLIADYQVSFSINKIAFTYRVIIYDVKNVN